MTIEPISDERLAEIRADIAIYGLRSLADDFAITKEDILAILASLDKAEAGWRIKAECYDTCESVARKRLAHIPPDLEAEIPRLCEIEQRIWEQHRDHMPINALDMLEHAKCKRLEERIAVLEAEAAAALEWIKSHLSGEGPMLVPVQMIDADEFAERFPTPNPTA